MPRCGSASAAASAATPPKPASGLFTKQTTAYPVSVGSLLGTLRNPKVAALVVGGLAALVISFVVPTSPETVTLVHGRPYHSSETHPIDVALTFCRFLGSLSLVVGICAM